MRAGTTSIPGGAGAPTARGGGGGVGGGRPDRSGGGGRDWGDEKLHAFSSRICYAFLERNLSFPEQRGPQVLTAPIPHILRVTGREGVDNRLLGRRRQEGAQRQHQAGESAPRLLLLQRLELAEARFQDRRAARQPLPGAGPARFRPHKSDQLRRQGPAAG